MLKEVSAARAAGQRKNDRKEQPKGTGTSDAVREPCPPSRVGRGRGRGRRLLWSKVAPSLLVTVPLQSPISENPKEAEQERGK